ncbi:MAG: tRNA pseudouridine(38-40) synthase TruA [Acidaminococcales bacterium]|jgi:tRNA pseudouridine38-40 synthase|nr:tRNA pseudouridine(38-40) synthase TruA [Acidaminococcales bacterium]
MRRLKLTIAYDGTGYHGFQRQKNQPTVQAVLEESLALIFGQPVTFNAAGRTDAGVHALGQVVSCSTEGRIPTGNILPAARSVLPAQVAVIGAAEVGEGFHARRSAKGKRYIYKIAEKGIPDPFLANYAWLLGEKLDSEKMNRAAECLIGQHDFSSFRAAGANPASPLRTIYGAAWERREGLLVFAISGDGFLYRMVRNIVGALAEVGRGQKSVEEFAGALAARDRRQAGKTAPPQGLYLERVFY